jgi:hypothetical protein
VILAASVVLLVIPWFGPVLFAPVPRIVRVVAARAERRYAGAALDYCIVLAFLWITPVAAPSLALQMRHLLPVVANLTRRYIASSC